MIDLAVLLTAITVLVLAFRQRPVVWVAAGVLAAVFFPVAATRSWFYPAGHLGRIHPSVWIFLIGFGVTTVFSPVKAAAPRVRAGVVVAIGLWLVATGAVVVQQSGLAFSSAFIVCYLTPPLAFLAIHAVVARVDADLWKKLVPVVLAAGAAQAVLALLQLLAHTSLVYGRYYASYYWWHDDLERSIGTLDSPLDLAAFLTMCIPLTAALRRTPLVFFLSALYAIGVVVSGSRTGVVMAAVAIVLIVFVRSANVVAAVLTSATVGVGTAVLLLSPVAVNLLGRFGAQGDTSTEARTDALGVGLDLASQHVLSGHGSGYAYTYSSAYLSSSFENAYLATAIDYGVLVGVALVLVQLGCVLSARRIPLLFRLPGVLAIVWGFSYSSFVSTSTFGTLSWTFIALAAIAGYRSLPPDAAPAHPGSDRVATAPRAASPRTVLGRA